MKNFMNWILSVQLRKDKIAETKNGEPEPVKKSVEWQRAQWRARTRSSNDSKKI